MARRGQIARQAVLPAPIGGLNTRDPVQSVPNNDALRLENWVVKPGKVATRRGYSLLATGLGGDVETLMEYAPATGVAKLYAAANGEIWRVDDADAVTGALTGSAAVAGLTSTQFQHTMFGTAAGSFLVLCNGSDSVRNFDGSSWTAPSITGVASSTLINVCAHKGRLWFVQKDTLKAWYLGTASIAGSATEFNMSSLFRKGGKLLAIGTWTRDGGSGPDDHFVAVSSQGEAIIYAGTDPSSSATWALVGVYSIPKPIGYRCLYRAGFDLAIITDRGLVSLSEVVSVSEGTQAATALTNKIAKSFEDEARVGRSNFGWQVIEYPLENLVIVNVPASDASKQFAFQIETRAWSAFTGIDALCWSMWGERIYFGDRDGSVWHYGEDTSDNLAGITATIQTAFSRMGSNGQKRFLMCRPAMTAPETLNPQFSILTDYDISYTTALNVVQFVDSGPAWDEGDWDTSSWSFAILPNSRWHAVNGYGHTGSLAFAITTDVEIQIHGFDVLFEPGGPV
jgi:hypothetical protein